MPPTLSHSLKIRPNELQSTSDLNYILQRVCENQITLNQLLVEETPFTEMLEGDKRHLILPFSFKSGDWLLLLETSGNFHRANVGRTLFVEVKNSEPVSLTSNLVTFEVINARHDLVNGTAEVLYTYKTTKVIDGKPLIWSEVEEAELLEIIEPRSDVDKVRASAEEHFKQELQDLKLFVEDKLSSKGY